MLVRSSFRSFVVSLPPVCVVFFFNESRLSISPKSSSGFCCKLILDSSKEKKKKKKKKKSWACGPFYLDLAMLPRCS